MLDPWIIEEIRRREREERQRREERPGLEMPVMPTRPSDSENHRSGDQGNDRGVVILDFSI